MANSKATSKVQAAVKRGDLPHISTQKCADCGKQAAHYDHRDYFLPLNVEPTCHSCNMMRGPAMGLHDKRCEKDNPLAMISYRVPETLRNKLILAAHNEGRSFQEYMTRVAKAHLQLADNSEEG